MFTPKIMWDMITSLFQNTPILYSSRVTMSSRLLIFQKGFAHSKSQLHLNISWHRQKHYFLLQKKGLYSCENRNSTLKETNNFLSKIYMNRRYTRQKDASRRLSAGQKCLWEYLCKNFVAKHVECWGFGHLVCTCHFATTERNVWIYFFINSVMLVLVIMKVHAACYDFKKS